MKEKERADSWKQKDPASYRVTITNEQTGAVEIDLKDCRAGVFITQRGDEYLDTSQGMFGGVSGLAVCLVKLPHELKRILDKAPKELMDLVEKIMKLTGA